MQRLARTIDTASDTAPSLAHLLRPMELWRTLEGTTFNWLADQASSISAALAFYCAFSLAPLLVIIVTVASWIVGAEEARGYVGEQLTALFGAQGAQVILHAMQSAQSPNGAFAAVVSTVTLILAATSIFTALESALKQIWGARAAAPGGLRGFVRTRLISLGCVLALGFILLVSLTLTTVLAALRSWIAGRYEALVGVLAGVDFLVSIGLATGLVALLYRYLPAKRLAWRHIILGALVTAILFHLGRWAIGLYLTRSTQPTAFGAASSFAALLLWLYYSAQIFLFGAEFTAYVGRSRKSSAAIAP